MRILFEGQPYTPDQVESWGLGPFASISRDGGDAVIPYVGYVFSPKICDSVFILPKVFLFEGSGKIEDSDKTDELEIAFGQYRIKAVTEITKEKNPLKEDGLDRVLFGLSTWIYRAIDKYSERHPKSTIIRRSYIQSVTSHSGSSNQTLLDTELSLIDFHKKHANLLTFITIVNSSGNHKIHWGKTISKVQPVIQDGIPYYTEFLKKNKTINYDEELIVLFYSVLQYLRQQYFFPIRVNLNYELLKPAVVDAMIESGRGTRLLRSIRRKYFKDELVLLWKLLYAFFEKSEYIRAGKAREEALLASSFDRVFEDMVDGLIGDDHFADLKENEDGKEIDHIFRGDSLLNDSLIYYIGDSKYYFYGNELDKKSLYKQFTYARNIIQLNIDIFNKESSKRKAREQEIIDGVRYRDDLTEGYNLTPNFFIRGRVKQDYLKDGHACYSEDHLEPNQQEMPDNTHFGNRPFDRDTLVLKAYDINFLYVLASYVTNSDNNSFKNHIHDRFRDDLLKVFDDKFDFYHVRPLSDDIITFVEKYFEKYIGNMYHGPEKDENDETDDFVWFAFDKGTKTEADLLTEFSGIADVKKEKLVDWSRR